jgi:hypothetical protein
MGADTYYRRSCEGKKTFDSKAQAKRNIRRWRGSAGARVGNLHAYRCMICDAFHIGSRREHDRPKPARFALVIPKTRTPF